MADLMFLLAPTSLAFADAARPRFPVARVFCIGRNYAAHAREMGADPDREEPFFFMKPPSALIQSERVPYPNDTESLHHEVELVACIGADKRIAAYGVGIDLTKRDRQNEAKAAAQPWERSKAFPFSAPISALVPAEGVDLAGARIAISVNGVVKQQSTLDHMIWNIEEMLARLDALWGLAPGDVVFTGTPEGVAAMSRGDRIEAEVARVAKLSFSLV